MDQTDFNNTMATLGWSAAAVSGFEEIAYGAAVSLIHYQDHLSPAGRQGWARANNELSDKGQSGILKTKQGFFLSWINQLRLQTFGTAFDDDSVSHQAILAVTPWALTDVQFQYCMNYIRTGQVPDSKQFEKKYLTDTEALIAKKVSDVVGKEAEKFLEYALVFAGGRSVALFFKIKKSTVGGAVADVAWNILANQLKSIQVADVTARFTCDEQRRKYLSHKGLSSYQPVA